MNPLAPSLLDQDATPATIRGAVSSWPREGGDDLLQQATAHARRLMQNDRAPASHDKYARCWGQFVRWLHSDERLSNFEEAPAKPFIIGMYIGALRARGLSKNSVLVHLAAIAYAHEMLGFERPWLKSHEVKREIDGLRREKMMSVRNGMASSGKMQPTSSSNSTNRLRFSMSAIVRSSA